MNIIWHSAWHIVGKLICVCVCVCVWIRMEICSGLVFFQLFAIINMTTNIIFVHRALHTCATLSKGWVSRMNYWIKGMCICNSDRYCRIVVFLLWITILYISIEIYVNWCLSLTYTWDTMPVSACFMYVPDPKARV